MNGKAVAAATLLAATLTLTGCTDNPKASPETVRAFDARWAALDKGQRSDACWAITAQSILDQQATAMARLAELFGDDWEKMTGLISKKC